MDPAALGLALGAVLTGSGSFITAAHSLRVQKRSSVDECNERIKQVQRAFREGMKVRDREDDERWSHLP